MGKQKKRERKFAHKPHKAVRPNKRKREDDGDDQVSPEEEAEQQKKAKEMQEHMDELKNLAETQSEFLDFLAKEDSDLLRFGENEDDAGAGEELVEEGEEQGERVHVLTSTLLERWQKDAPKNFKALHQLVKAFELAAHVSDSATDVTKVKKPTRKFSYKIQDSTLFNDVIVFALKEMVSMFMSHLSEPGEPKDPNNNDLRSKIPPNTLITKRFPTSFPKIKLLVRLYLTSLVHFLGNLTEEKMITFCLKQTERMIPLFAPFPKIYRALFKRLLSLWGTSSEAVRILAFLNIRAMALELPYPQINDCLKGIYLTYVQNAKFSNPKTQPLINFMCNCVAELYGIDMTASYQHAFVYIRQISVHLRASTSTPHSTDKGKKQTGKRGNSDKTAPKKKTAKGYESIYNWQVINSINLWVKVLCTYPDSEQLWMLAYPLVQLIHAIIGLVPTPRYYPLRCVCVQMLNRLAQTKGKLPAQLTSNPGQPVSNKEKTTAAAPSFFINSAGYLLEILNFCTAFFQKESVKFRPYAGKPPSVQHYMLMAPDKLLGTKVFMDGILAWVHDLLLSYLVTYARSIAFPELALPIVIHVKNFIKHSVSAPRRGVKGGGRVGCAPAVTNKLKSLIQAVQQQSALIQSQRSLVHNYGPCNTSQVASFLSSKTANLPELLPLEKYAKDFARRQQHSQGGLANQPNAEAGDADNEEADDDGEIEDEEEEEEEEEGGPPQKKRKLEVSQTQPRKKVTKKVQDDDENDGNEDQVMDLDLTKLLAH